MVHLLSIFLVSTQGATGVTVDVRVPALEEAMPLVADGLGCLQGAVGPALWQTMVAAGGSVEARGGWLGTAPFLDARWRPVRGPVDLAPATGRVPKSARLSQADGVVRLQFGAAVPPAPSVHPPGVASVNGSIGQPWARVLGLQGWQARLTPQGTLAGALVPVASGGFLAALTPRVSAVPEAPGAVLTLSAGVRPDELLAWLLAAYAQGDPIRHGLLVSLLDVLEKTVGKRLGEDLMGRGPGALQLALYADGSVVARLGVQDASGLVAALGLISRDLITLGLVPAGAAAPKPGRTQLGAVWVMEDGPHRLWVGRGRFRPMPSPKPPGSLAADVLMAVHLQPVVRSGPPCNVVAAHLRRDGFEVSVLAPPR